MDPSRDLSKIGPENLSKFAGAAGPLSAAARLGPEIWKLMRTVHWLRGFDAAGGSRGTVAIVCKRGASVDLSSPNYCGLNVDGQIAAQQLDHLG